MNIGITGADGFFGWHLRALLHLQAGHNVWLAGRATFSDPKRLDGFVAVLDAVVHLAGTNKHDGDAERSNLDLARELTASFERTGRAPRVVFSNSIWSERDDVPYGRGKRAAADHLRAWAERSDTPVADLVFPHTFGEFGRPFHNSVVSTFCHQLARGDTPQILVDGDLELIHVQEAAARCLRAAEAGENGRFRVRGTAMTVSALLDRLRHMTASYAAGIIPDLRNPLDARLFNTLRSYLYPEHYPAFLTPHSDSRGTLFEAVRGETGGQVFLSTTHSGATRGDHVHTRKVERFLVVSGEAQIRLRRLFSDQVNTFRVSGGRPCYIDIPTFYTHNIVNVGTSDLVTLFWTNEIFDPIDSDTYHEPVLDP